jgi:hypothetical protein
LFTDVGIANRVINSTAQPIVGSGMAFRDFNYVEIAGRSIPDGEDKPLCLDTGCGMSSIDRAFFKAQFPNAVVRQVPSPIEIRGIGDKVSTSTDYSLVTMFLPGHKPDSDEPCLASITREFHIVEKLACNVLIGNDIIDPECIQIDVTKRKAIIGSCEGLICPLRITTRGKPVEHRMVRTRKTVILRPHTKTLITVHAKNLPTDRDFSFQPRYDASTSYLAVHGIFPEAIVNAKSLYIAYYNNSSTSLLLPENSKIGEISEWQTGERATRENPDVINYLFGAARILPSLGFTTKVGITALQCAQVLGKPGDTVYPIPDLLPSSLSADVYSLLSPLDESIMSNPVITNNPAEFGPEAVNVNTSDDITQDQINALRNTLFDHSPLWEDRIGRIIEPEADWMDIPLKDGAIIESKGRYRVSKRDEAIIDEMFSRARKDGRMSPVDGVVPVG